jgi:hypothetical protein
MPKARRAAVWVSVNEILTVPADLEISVIVNVAAVSPWLYVAPRPIDPDELATVCE